MFSPQDVRRIAHTLVGEAETDVLVVGGGTAGFIAGAAAARTGARTVLAEYLPFLGGMHGGGGLILSGTGFYHTYLGDRRHSLGENLELLVGGLPLEYWNRLVESRGAYGQEGTPALNIINDLELTKVVAERLVEESGSDIWLMAPFVDAVVDRGRLTGALLSRGGGLWHLRSKVVVDASGDGIVSALAGAPCAVGRPGDERTQPGSMFFEVGGVDILKTLRHLKDHPEDFAETHYGFPPSADYLMEQLGKGNPVRFKVSSGYQEAKRKGKLPLAPGAGAPPVSLGSIYLHWKDGRVVPTMVSLNMDMVYGLDPRDRDGYDAMLVETKRFVTGILEHYRKHVPGFQEAWVSRFPTLLGVRESRRIVGRYVLTEADALAGATFPDAVGRCGAFIDVHGEEVDVELDHREVGGERGWFHIPYRALLPQEREGLLAAGRIISSDHIVNGSIRNQVICMMTGHAAGTAAALCALGGLPAGELAAETLQKKLKEQGAII